jgi:hypothetical protein
MNQLLRITSRLAGAFLITFLSFSSFAQSNYAVSFDGANDYISTTSYVVPTTGDFTVELWVYATSYTGYQEYVSQGSAGSAFYIGTTNGTGVIRCGDNWGSTGITMPLNQWVHIALVKSGTSATLYLNGIQKATLASAYSVSSAGTAFQIGAQYGGIGEYFNGKVDEVRIWNTVRAQAQIKANMFNKNLSNGATGLVAYYRMNNGSGTTATNSCSNTAGIDGTLTNGPTWSASPIQFAGNALKFNGSSNYVELTNRINIGSSDFTIEAWVYPQSTSAGMVFAQDVCGDGEQQFRLYTNSSKVNFDLSDAAALGAPYSFQLISTASSVPLNTWTHIAVTRSGNNYTLYINGVSNATTSTGTNTINNQSGADVNKRLRIGSRGGVSAGCGLNYFNGSIDEVRFWNVARTETQIQQNYAREIDPASNANLAAYYTFNEGIAAGTNTGLTTVIDQSGNNNGTLTNFSLSGSTSNFLTQNSSMFILPLKWLSFTAQKQNENVLLQWNTASESNTSNFQIEHRADGNGWETIGAIVSNNANETNHYSYIDSNPSDGINYYRIRQNDKDGKYSYNKIVSITVEKETSSFRLLANPVTGKTLRVEINSAHNQIISLAGCDGKIIWIKEFSPGLHSINLNTPAGTYLLLNEHTRQKLLIQ